MTRRRISIRRDCSEPEPRLVLDPPGAQMDLAEAEQVRADISRGIAWLKSQIKAAAVRKARKAVNSPEPEKSLEQGGRQASLEQGGRQAAAAGKASKVVPGREITGTIQ